MLVHPSIHLLVGWLVTYCLDTTYGHCPCLSNSAKNKERVEALALANSQLSLTATLVTQWIVLHYLLDFHATLWVDGRTNTCWGTQTSPMKKKSAPTARQMLQQQNPARMQGTSQAAQQLLATAEQNLKRCCQHVRGVNLHQTRLRAISNRPTNGQSGLKSRVHATKNALHEDIFMGRSHASNS